MTNSLKDQVRTVPNWPKKGVMFRDITTLLQNPASFQKCINILVKKYRTYPIDVVVGIEARGFILGAILADRLKVGFVPIRKAGKLPAATFKQSYSLEYGQAKIEIHKDALKPKQKVLVVDDLLATGGTTLAACRLIEKTKAKVLECAFVINLPDLNGTKLLKKKGYRVFSLVTFTGE